MGETVIGAEIQVRGRVEGKEDLRVHGRVEGSISLTETLFVEASGIILAEVEAHDVVVSGIVVGNVTATNSLSLEPGAKLVGNISTPRLIIADGAAFKGEVQMGDAPVVTRERARAAARRDAVSKAKATAPAPTKAKKEEARAPRAAPARKAPPSRAPARAATQAAPPRPAATAAAARDDDGEVTVVVKHAALRRGQAAEVDEAPARAPAGKAKKKKAAKKKAARARVPARGKRRVGRR